MDTQTNGIYQTLIASLAFITALLVLFLVFMISHLRTRLRVYREQFNREIELIDMERNRISADLHDELGSGLSAVGLFMRQAAESNDSHQLQKALLHLGTQQKKIREISHDLVPRTLETHGLAVTLKELYDEIRDAGKIELIVIGNLDTSHIQPSKTVHLYRIMREILVNALKHSGASSITISYYQKRQWLWMEVHDNGKGFDKDSLNIDYKGNGLKNVQARIDLLEGIVNVHSEKDKGTHYSIRIPLSSIMIPNGK